MRPIAALLVFLLCAMVPAFVQDTARLPVVGVLRIDTTSDVGPLVIRDALPCGHRAAKVSMFYPRRCCSASTKSSVCSC